ASKGCFDRALTPLERHRRHLPSTATISRDEFLEATTDLWEIPSESATRVGHPAPFPVAIPQRLIDLYTYRQDVVLDPFMGAGTTAVAAVRSDRHYIGFDTDRSYVERAQARIAAERLRCEETSPQSTPLRVRVPAIRPQVEDRDLQDRAVREGRRAKELAEILLDSCGFVNLRPDVKFSDLGIDLSFVGEDRRGHRWGFELAGAFASNRAGLKRADALWKAIAKAAVVHEGHEGMCFVLLATEVPAPGTPPHLALSAVRGPGRPVFDVIEILSHEDRERLRACAVGAPQGS
ncbi:MAG: DNA-methyltransferase, partial [Acidimicrobiales bacterium]